MAAGPATPLIMGAVSLAGTAVSAFGQAKDTGAKQRQLELNEQQFKRHAAFTRKAAARQDRIFRADAEREFSSQVANYGASGVTLAGSPLLKLNQTRARIESQSRAISDQAIHQARNANLKAQGAAMRRADLGRALPLNIAGTLLTGGFQAASSFSAFKGFGGGGSTPDLPGPGGGNIPVRPNL